MGASTFELLLQTLKEACGNTNLSFEGEPSLLLGGMDAELVRFRLRKAPSELSGELVARIVHKPNVGPWEAAVQRAVARAGFPTPAVRLTVDESSPLGRYLIVMDYLDGRPLIGDTNLVNPAKLVRDQLRLVPDELANMAARLHLLDASELEAELAALPKPLAFRASEYLAQLVETARQLGVGELVRAGEALLEAVPECTSHTITHGDLHPLNLMVSQGRTWLIDWSSARVTDPGYTLGFTYLLLANPPIEVPKPIRPAVQMIGRYSARRFLKTYNSLTRGTIAEINSDSLEWHLKLHAVRMLVEPLMPLNEHNQQRAAHPFNLVAPATAQRLGVSWPLN